MTRALGSGSPAPGRIGFARWRSGTPSGGNAYDDALLAGLRSAGLHVAVHPVEGPWPLPEAGHLADFDQLLRCERDWLVNNIVASAAPDSLRRVTASRCRVCVLVHYFPADDPALSAHDRRLLAASEAAALTAATSVVVTSAWAAAEVATRYGRRGAVVARPGVGDVEPVRGSWPEGRPPSLLWLGRLSAPKDPLTFVRALARVAHLPWTARLVGPDADPPLTREVRQLIAAAGLEHRVQLTGALTGASLASVWAEADILVHSSRSETYGMVIAEALARGVPSVVAEGTGAVEAQLGSGGRFPPGDVDALAHALRTWLADPSLRQRWRADALRLRPALPTWQGAAAVVAAVLRR